MTAPSPKRQKQAGLGGRDSHRRDADKLNRSLQTGVQGLLSFTDVAAEQRQKLITLQHEFNDNTVAVYRCRMLGPHSALGGDPDKLCDAVRGCLQAAIRSTPFVMLRAHKLISATRRLQAWWRTCNRRHHAFRADLLQYWKTRERDLREQMHARIQKMSAQGVLRGQTRACAETEAYQKCFVADDVKVQAVAAIWRERVDELRVRMKTWISGRSGEKEARLCNEVAVLKNLLGNKIAAQAHKDPETAQLRSRLQDALCGLAELRTMRPRLDLSVKISTKKLVAAANLIHTQEQLNDRIALASPGDDLGMQACLDRGWANAMEVQEAVSGTGYGRARMLTSPVALKTRGLSMRAGSFARQCSNLSGGSARVSVLRLGRTSARFAGSSGVASPLSDSDPSQGGLTRYVSGMSESPPPSPSCTESPTFPGSPVFFGSPGVRFAAKRSFARSAPRSFSQKARRSSLPRQRRQSGGGQRRSSRGSRRGSHGTGIPVNPPTPAPEPTAFPRQETAPVVDIGRQAGGTRGVMPEPAGLVDLTTPDCPQNERLLHSFEEGAETVPLGPLPLAAVQSPVPRLGSMQRPSLTGRPASAPCPSDGERLRLAPVPRPRRVGRGSGDDASSAPSSEEGSSEERPHPLPLSALGSPASRFQGRQRLLQKLEQQQQQQQQQQSPPRRQRPRGAADGALVPALRCRPATAGAAPGVPPGEIREERTVSVPSVGQRQVFTPHRGRRKTAVQGVAVRERLALKLQERCKLFKRGGSPPSPLRLRTLAAPVRRRARHLKGRSASRQRQQLVRARGRSPPAGEERPPSAAPAEAGQLCVASAMRAREAFVSKLRASNASPAVREAARGSGAAPARSSQGTNSPRMKAILTDAAPGQDVVHQRGLRGQPPQGARRPGACPAPPRPCPSGGGGGARCASGYAHAEPARPALAAYLRPAPT
eukprot:TRINITY_DN1669_c0_g1_i1.p1 TRINITY_DN1669_c0_g1~~TRINITY_DN1669_c0_g1_i1.p1  ORF type:complete len:938 (+),score=159.70 TRINITY_DN1669_c0_g1_i1:86-2899(+)